MSALPPGNPPDDKKPPEGFTQDVNYAQASARVPERVGRGVYATAVLVLTGSHELAFDFLLRMVPPAMLSARVIVPHSILPSIVHALNENWEGYRARFGSPPAQPTQPPPGAQAPKIADVYADMKQPEEVMVGAYANTLMISHTSAEFCFDFIVDLFPRPVVTCRVYLSALQIPGLLDTLKRSLGQLQAAQQAQLQQQMQQQKAAEGKKPTGDA